MAFSEITFVENLGDKDIHGKMYIKYNKIPFFEIIEESNDEIKLALYNQIKTTEHKYEFLLKLPENQRSQFFAKHGFFKLENHYINTGLITFIKEERLNPSKVKLTFFFEGYPIYLILYTNWGRWESWRNIRVK